MRDSRGDDPYILESGSRVAVIGSGPTGSFFSIFALKMAKMVGKEIQVTIFDPKDFTKDGPVGCNKCGGIISELLVQTLAVEGINLPDSVVRKGINSYKLHTEHGSAFIATPSHEKRIATVYRGGGPKGIIGNEKESFDEFLLKQAVEEGAVHTPLKIDRIEFRNKRPVLFAKEREVCSADLVVGAVGVKSGASKMFEGIGFGYREPSTITASISEIGFDEGTVSEYFGDSIQLFLLPDKDIKFAAMIPKGNYITVCILGRKIDAHTIDDFLEKPFVKNVLPKTDYKLDCRCLPKMNIGAPHVAFADRLVMCGDAGSTRLFKDGLGAAYIMGKAVAKTAVFQGVSKGHFRRHYYPVYKSIIIDNRYGRYLYSITDIYRRNKILTQGMLRVVRKEQDRSGNTKSLSSILWDMFTGNERYKNIFPRAFSARMHIELWTEFAKIAVGGGRERR